MFRLLSSRSFFKGIINYVSLMKLLEKLILSFLLVFLDKNKPRTVPNIATITKPINVAIINFFFYVNYSSFFY